MESKETGTGMMGETGRVKVAENGEVRMSSG